MLREKLFKWFYNWEAKNFHYHSIQSIEHNEPGYFDYVKIKYNDGYYLLPFFLEKHIICSYLNELGNNFSPKSWKRIILYSLSHVIGCIFNKIQKCWINRNNLMPYYTKRAFEKLTPIIKEDPYKLEKIDLIYYIDMVKEYPKEVIDSLGFEKRPRKKVGKFKKIWYNLILKAY